MKRNIIIGVLLAVIIAVIVGGIFLLKSKIGDDKQVNKEIIEELQNKSHARKIK